jgi:hypothetical protein
MSPLALVANALALIPYEPSYDCVKTPAHPTVELVIRNGSEIRWNGTVLTRDRLESYLVQERAFALKDQAVFRIFADNVSSKVTAEVVGELKAANLPFGKNCEGIP